ncbi:hypothetical protein PUNSTDRAFT_39746, partial [Punctularia strigosozonata HHB-11173 SS5]|uniref:uncharacterized protein n=1 Tax=Punctularia strigosozonata (strain HHB-11173) TaxID=741275 RepID=UPI00044166A6
DNVYAREITLHELGVLHDGLALTGPLRLRLQSSSPRFIQRYHELRNHIARLNIDADNEETYA